MTTLDKLALVHTKIDLLKIDVEGYKKFVLEGGQNTLKNTETIFFESWNEHFKKFGYSLSEIFMILDQFGFEYFVIDKAGYKKIDQTFDADICTDIVATKNSVQFLKKMAGSKVS